MPESITVNFTSGVRAALDNLLTVAEHLEDNARIVDHLPDEPYGNLDEFRVSVYEPLRDTRSVTSGPGRNYTFASSDARLVFNVLEGLSEGWTGGTPWKALNPAERSALERFLGTLRRIDKQ